MSLLPLNCCIAIFYILSRCSGLMENILHSFMRHCMPNFTLRKTCVVFLWLQSSLHKHTYSVCLELSCLYHRCVWFFVESIYFTCFDPYFWFLCLHKIPIVYNWNNLYAYTNLCEGWFKPFLSIWIQRWDKKKYPWQQPKLVQKWLPLPQLRGKCDILWEPNDAMFRRIRSVPTSTQPICFKWKTGVLPISELGALVKR